MAKISAYPNGTAPQSSDNFVIARGGRNYRLNWSSLEAEQLSIMQDTKDPTGWVSPELITVSYDATSRKITLTGTLEYYWRGVKTTLTSPWTSDAHDSADGRYFLYSTDGVTFAWSTDTWEFYELMVAIARKKTTPAYQFGLREPHGLMPWQVHRELHETLSAYRVSGGGLTIGTYAENTATDAATTPGFDALVMADEDIETTIAAWLQGTYTTLRVGASSVSTFDTTATFPFRSSGSYILINDPATGAETAGANNNYVNVYIIRIPTTSDAGSQSYRLVCLQPQRAYSSLAAAQAEDTRSLSLGDIGTSLPEFVFYERITYILASGDANTGKCRIATGGISYIFGSRMSQISAGGVGPVQTAENTPFTPNGNISATNVQAAIVEVRDDADTLYLQKSGWVLTSWSNPTRTSNTTFTVDQDVTALVQKGYKFKFTDTTTKYGVLASVSYNAGTGKSTLTFFATTDYILVGNPSAISYSNVAQPLGWPGWFANAAPTLTTTFFDNGSGGQPTTEGLRWCIQGTHCTVVGRFTGVKATTDTNLFVFADTDIPLINRSITSGRWTVGFTSWGTLFGNTGYMVHFTDNNYYGGFATAIPDNTVIGDAGFTIYYEV